MKIIVIGAGLAGAACAYALAKRGAQVQVLHQGAAASELPVGMLVPHLSWQDVLISQLSRLGVSCTFSHARALLREGVDWQPCPVRQRLLDTPERNARLVEAARHLPDWMAVEHDALVHLQAAWIAPQALVRAWLQQPGIAVQAAAVASLRFESGLQEWQVLDAQGNHMAQAAHVILANGIGAEALLRRTGFKLNLSEVAGQVAMGFWPRDEGSVAFNGNGHFMAGMPADLCPGLRSPTGASPAAMWLSGSSYERPPFAPPEAHKRAGLQTNLARLRDLLPAAWLPPLEAQSASGDMLSWEGHRCTTSDRLPVVGTLRLPDSQDAVAADNLARKHSGLHISTAMGSRGLSFAALCGEWLAQRILGGADTSSAEREAWMAQLRPDRPALFL